VNYAPLVAYLRTSPVEQAEIVLRLAEIEALVGMPLPPTAHRLSQHWHRPGEPRAAAQAGFRARLERRQQQVRFTRVVALAPVPQAGPPNAAALLHFLLTRPAEQTAVDLSVTELSTLLGRALPLAAAVQEDWTPTATERRQWQRLGWQVRLDQRHARVRFRRQRPPAQ
jgi:hypothetical protein